MRRLLSPSGIIPILVLLLCAGCRLWDVETLTLRDPLSSEMLEALRGQLSRDAWRPNPRWSLLEVRFHNIDAGRSTSIPHWTFGNSVVQEAVVELDGAASQQTPGGGEPPAKLPGESHSPAETTAATAVAAGNDVRADAGGNGPQQWDGFWPLNVDQVIESLAAIESAGQHRDRLGERYLRKLAREESLAGWNAAILLARRDPPAAREFLPLLERLVGSSANQPLPRPGELARADTGEEAGTETPTDEPTSALVERLARRLREGRAADGTISNGEDRADDPLAARLIDDLLERVPSASPASRVNEPQREENAVSDSMRAAAAEAWCLVLASGEGDPLERMAPAGRLLERTDLPNRVRAELYRGVARRVPPALIPRLENALRVSPQGERVPLEVRQAAIDACLIHAFESRPSNVAGASSPSRLPQHTLVGRRDRSHGHTEIESRESRVESSRADDPAPSTLNPQPSTDHIDRTVKSTHGPPAYDASQWPRTVLNCRSDADAGIRRTFGRWAAVAGYRTADDDIDAAGLLEAQLRDRHPRVRQSALLSLGWLGTPAAREILRSQAEQPQPLVRASAIAGLSRWGAEELALRIDDESALVRKAVAAELSQHPSIRSSFLLLRLLRDDDLQVQQAAVDSVSDWPDDPALSLLLAALRDGSRLTRQLAFEQLRRRRPIDDAFENLDSPRHEERTRAVEKLAAKLDVTLEFADRGRDGSIVRGQQATSIHRRDVEALLRAATDPDLSPASRQHAEFRSRLAKLQADDLPIVEDFLLRRSPGNADLIYRDLLPRLSPAHASLNDLEQPDLQAKRRAARRLRQAAEVNSLSRLAVQRLLAHLDGGQDALVWREAMTAVMPDAADEHAQVALRALNDDRAEIRLLGCQYVQRHRQPQHASWLHQLGLFRDSEKRVRLTAIEAAGLCGNPRGLDDFAGAADAAGTSPAAAALKSQSENLDLGWPGLDRREAPVVRSPGLRKDSSPGHPVVETGFRSDFQPGLRSLLTDADDETRIAAVISMARLGDDLGIDELSRLCWHSVPAVRLQAVRAMGETESSRLIGPLIRRGWTEQHADVRRAILKSLDQLTLPGKRPPDLLDENGYDAKIATWVAWWEQRRAVGTR